MVRWYLANASDSRLRGGLVDLPIGSNPPKFQKKKKLGHEKDFSTHQRRETRFAKSNWKPDAFAVKLLTYAWLVPHPKGSLRDMYVCEVPSIVYDRLAAVDVQQRAVSAHALFFVKGGLRATHKPRQLHACERQKCNSWCTWSILAFERTFLWSTSRVKCECRATPGWPASCVISLKTFCIMHNLTRCFGFLLPWKGFLIQIFFPFIYIVITYFLVGEFVSSNFVTPNWSLIMRLYVAIERAKLKILWWKRLRAVLYFSKRQSKFVLGRSPAPIPFP